MKTPEEWAKYLHWEDNSVASITNADFLDTVREIQQDAQPKFLRVDDARAPSDTYLIVRKNGRVMAVKAIPDGLWSNGAPVEHDDEWMPMP